eukprot:577372-Amorphochlora_amoeboformis.AAC.1
MFFQKASHVPSLTREVLYDPMSQFKQLATATCKGSSLSSVLSFSALCKYTYPSSSYVPIRGSPIHCTF